MTRPTKEGCCSCQAAGPSDPSRPAKKTTGRTSSSRRRRRNRCAGRRFRNSCKWPSHSGRSRHWPRSSRQESSGSPGCQCTASYRVSGTEERWKVRRSAETVKRKRRKTITQLLSIEVIHRRRPSQTSRPDKRYLRSALQPLPMAAGIDMVLPADSSQIGTFNEAGDAHEEGLRASTWQCLGRTQEGEVYLDLRNLDLK